LVLSFTCITEAETTDQIEKSFNVDYGGTLTIDTDIGSIEVKSVTGKNVHINILKELRQGDEADLDDFKVSFDQNGDDVTITGEWEGSRWRRNNRLRVKFMAEVPREYNLNLYTSGGSISVDDIEGEVNSKTSGGSLHFGSIIGPVVGNTSGGSITLKGCEGDANIHTSGGSITIGEVTGNVDAKTSGGSIKIDKAQGNITARTSGGSIRVDEVMGTIDASTSGGSVSALISKQPKENCTLKTSGGSVNVQLAENIAVDLNASTSSGRVNSELDILVQGTVGKGKLIGKVNGGGPELYLRTSGGNINIKKL
jgi:hypothetical protein